MAGEAPNRSGANELEVVARTNSKSWRERTRSRGAIELKVAARTNSGHKNGGRPFDSQNLDQFRKRYLTTGGGCLLFQVAAQPRYEQRSRNRLANA